jgi:hypothetical protein
MAKHASWMKNMWVSRLMSLSAHTLKSCDRWKSIISNTVHEPRKSILIFTAFSLNRVETFLNAIVNNNNLSLLLLNDDHLEVFASNNWNTSNLAYQSKPNTIEHPNSTLLPL